MGQAAPARSGEERGSGVSEGLGVSHDPARVTAWLRRRATELGFARIGVSRAEALDEPAERLAAWLREGRHGSMRYMANHQDVRRDPRALLAGARTIVSVAMNYYTSARPPGDAESRAPQNGKRGRISRYAWGRDYHTVLRERMAALLTEILAALPGESGRVVADAVPLPEKAIAQRAGLGWIGKHTNLITRTHGSWVFLGEILLTAELEYDAPFSTDLCGSCTRCIEACPTEAIVAPYELDATRCISYATIENRGRIPSEFEGRMDGWLFGCDVCQEVCPWNRFAEETDVADFAPREEVLEMTLDEAANLTRPQFLDRFHDSAIRRTRRDGLRRNARFLMKEAGGRPED